ncbi:MAG: hypothetical protein K2O24_00305 [Muribaculaceae bacterium]|nr:hypothetical protein [Muribaculaceae bacterium]
MNKQSFLSLAVALASAFALASCSNNDEPAPFNPDLPVFQQGTANAEVARGLEMIKSLASGEVNKTFTCTEHRLFHNDQDTDYKWEEINLHDYEGFESPIPGRLYVVEGAVWQPYKTFHLATGPSTIGTVWSIYKRQTGVKKDLYIASRIVVDEMNATAEIGGNTCRIVGATDNTFTIAYDSEYCKGDGSTGTFREFSTFTVSDLTLPDSERLLLFDSEEDLIRDLLARFRETFGESINVNSYLYPSVILDDEMIVVFDELEEELLGK